MQTHLKLEQLNEKHGIVGALRFDTGRGGLVRAEVDTDLCKAAIYLHGAHVSEFAPVGTQPVLFMSASSNFESGKPIRGGVPVCFPWFGPYASDPSKPSHGPVRLTEWQVLRTAVDEGAVAIELEAQVESLVIRHTVSFGQDLTMKLSVHNTLQTYASFESALHTYLAVSDVRHIRIEGLEGAAYLDSIDEDRLKHQDGNPITFSTETDRLYVDTDATCVLFDPGLGRRIKVSKSGSRSTVVWNPWIDKAARLEDMGDDEWPGMVCIETANAGPNAVKLATGKTHQMTATISVTEL